jgi:hypothetical protein
MLSKTLAQRQALTTIQRRFASTSDYHSLNDQVFYAPRNEVAFAGDRFAVFDNSNPTERRFAPYVMKELAFKNVMGLGGTCFILHMCPYYVFLYPTLPFWLGNWAYQSWNVMSNAVRQVELHKDGKSVTLHPIIGNPFDAKIKDIKKLENEKSLVETFEESFLFPIAVSGKKYVLHGNGQESIKNGELFRAIINGQSIKL